VIKRKLAGVCGPNLKCTKPADLPDGPRRKPNPPYTRIVDSRPALLKSPVVLLKSAPVPRLVLSCAAATPARESDKKSAAIKTEKNEAVVSFATGFNRLL